MLRKRHALESLIDHSNSLLHSVVQFVSLCRPCTMQCLWIACLGSREAGSSRAVTGSVNRECPQFETEVDCPVFPLLSKERIFADHCKWLHESLPVAANVFQVLHCRLNCNTLLRMIPKNNKIQSCWWTWPRHVPKLAWPLTTGCFARHNLCLTACWPDIIEPRPPALLDSGASHAGLLLRPGW